MLHTPQAQDSIRQAPDLPTAAFQDDDFEAMVVVQMHVGGRENLARRRMLGHNQLGREIRLVVVANYGECSHNHLVFFSRLVH